jgi:alkylation response protein AidB-like acyl-CoA dehydrogenase
MNLSRSPEHQMLQESADRYVQRNYNFERRRALLAESGGFHVAIWRDFADLGWLATTLPERDGGLGLGLPGAAIITEALGKGLVTEPLLPVLTAANLLAAVEESPLRTRLLGAIANAQSLVVPALMEAGAHGEATQIDTVAEPAGESSFRLTGEKKSCLGAAEADTLLVSARLPTGVTGVFAVGRPSDGVLVEPFRTVDHRSAAHIRFAGTQVGADCLLAKGQHALWLIEQATHFAVVCSCAETVGVMDRSLTITCEYLKTRRQFGAPLAGFQTLQHRVADMFIELEQARAIFAGALALVDQGDPRTSSLIVSAAKARVGQAAKFLMAQAIQLHGAIGLTEEYIIGHYFKRVAMNEVLLGTTADHLEKFARLSRTINAGIS